MKSEDEYYDEFAALFEKRNYLEILKLAHKAINDGHDWFRIPLTRAAYFLELKDAIEIAEDAVSYFPNDDYLLRWYARILEEHKRYDESLEQFKKAAELGSWWTSFPVYINAVVRIRKVADVEFDDERYNVRELLMQLAGRIDGIPKKDLTGSASAISEALRESGDYETRYLFCKQVFKKVPSVFNERKLARAAQSLGYTDIADMHYALALDRGDGDLKLQKEYEGFLRDTGGYAHALSLVKARYESAPSVEAAKEYLSFASQGLDAHSIQPVVDQVMERFSNQAEIMESAMFALNFLGANDMAVRIGEKLLKRKVDAFTLTRMMTTFAQAKHTSLYEKALGKFEAQQPTLKPWMYHWLIWPAQAQNDLEKVFFYAQKKAESYPNDSFSQMFCHGLASMLEEQERVEFYRARVLDPDHMGLLRDSYRAELFFLEENEAALGALVNRLDSNPLVTSKRVEIFRAWLSILRGTYPSLSALMELGGINASNNHYFCTLGLTALHEGRLDVAQTIYDRRTVHANSGVRSRSILLLSRKFLSAYEACVGGLN